MRKSFDVSSLLRAAWVVGLGAAAAGCGGADSTTTVTVTAATTPATARPTTSTAAPTAQPLALPPAPAQPSTGLPRATLRVAPDGCGVLRSEFRVDPDALQWVVEDQQGFQVLARNARGETRYRYFRPGSYSVVLQTYGDGKYEPISNTVTIRC